MKGLLSWLLNEAKDKGFLVIILLFGGHLFMQQSESCNEELIGNLKDQNTRMIIVIEQNNKALNDHSRAIESFSMYLSKNIND